MGVCNRTTTDGGIYTCWPDCMAFDGFALEQAGGRTHPFHISVMIDAHHEPSSHPQDGEHRHEFVNPDIHDPYLHLGSAKGCRDDRLKMQALLQDVLRSALRRYGRDVCFLGCDHNPKSSKRI